MEIGDLVTVWFKPKSSKGNSGDDGIITDIYKTTKGIKYRVQYLHRGTATITTALYISKSKT